MSFLLRRHMPWVWAGWIDEFARPVENPIRQPWKHYGDGTPALINDSQEMQIPDNFSSSVGGGESYEFMPFTPNFGHEWEMYWPASGLAAQYFNLFIVENWAKVGVNYANILCIRLRHRIGALGGDDVSIWQFSDFVSPGSALAVAPSPVPFDGSVITIRVWVDNDQLVRVWANDVPMVQAMPDAAHRPKAGRRGMNFFNNALATAYVRWIKVYDRVTDFPLRSLWGSVFYDDFNRANGSVGNGWTESGTGAGISSNTWSVTATTDGSRGILRNTGVTTGAQRIEARVGGNFPPSTSADSSIVLRCKADGSEGIAANFFANHIYIAKFTGSLSSPTFTDYVDTAATVATGDLVAFSARGDYAWVEVNGVVVAQVQMFGSIPISNSWAGLRVERSGTNSMSWNDVHIYGP